MYAALRDHDPVHHVEHGDYWVLSRFADVFAAARDTATFSSAQGLTFEYGEREKAGLAEADPMVMMDPPDHTAFRRLVGRASRRATSRRSSRPSGPSWSSGSSGCGRRDRATWWRAVQAAPELRGRLLPRRARGGLAPLRRVDRGHRGRQRPGRPPQAGDTVGELFVYFSELIEQKRAAPGDDTISALVQTGADDVSLMQVLGFAFTMVTGGNDTTTGMLGVAAELLTRFPDQRALLLADPGLLDGAIEELLRLSAPVQGLARTPTRDVELHGRTIPAGRKVLLLYGSANRDPRVRRHGRGLRRAPRDRVDHDVRLRRPPLPRGRRRPPHGPRHARGAAGPLPDFAVDHEAGTFGPGHFVRRYESLPFMPTCARAWPPASPERSARRCRRPS